MRFFINRSDICGNTVEITGDDCVHIGVSLRSRPGQKITVCDEQMREYDCVITSISQTRVLADIVDIRSATTEPNVKIHLYQSIAKGDKLDLIVQKTTEIGVCDITLVDSKRCVAKYDGKTAEKKVERLSRIAESAAKQSGRAAVPAVNAPVPFEKAVKEAQGLKIFCYELEQSVSFRQILSSSCTNEISVFVGPEGGYTDDEAAYAVDHGAMAVTLGKRILRCETAPIFAISCIIYETEL